MKKENPVAMVPPPKTQDWLSRQPDGWLHGLSAWERANALGHVKFWGDSPASRKAAINYILKMRKKFGVTKITQEDKARILKETGWTGE